MRQQSHHFMTLFQIPTLQWLVKVAPDIVTAGLLVLAAGALADLTWLWLMPPPPLPVAATTAPIRQTTATAANTNDGDTIAAFHLFGEAKRNDNKTEPPPSQVEMAPQTNLNLTLKGVLATGDDESLAIIGLAGGREQRLFKIGEALPGGVVLHHVYPDRVILRRSGRLETLPFPQNSRSGVNTAPVATAKQPPAPHMAPPQPQPDSANTATRLYELRRDLMRNPSKLGSLLNPSPAREGDRFLGYRVRPRGDAEIVDILGLENGDIVTSINGIALDQPEKGLMAARKLLNADTIELEVLRNGRSVQITHAVAD